MARKVGKRKTNQRQAIQEVIEQAGRPLMVKEIHELASDKVEGLGIATVYRTLKLLLEAESLKTVCLPDGETRYEPTGLGHHHHFKCLDCESVFDLDHCPISIPKGTVFPEGFVLQYHEITLYGRCPECVGGRA